MSSKKILHELKHHYPFTFAATTIAIIIIIFIKFSLNKEIPESFFHILHPAHLFVSAIVTSALYYKYKKRIFPALLIGLTGSIIIGSLSDIILPWLGGKSLGFNISFHLALIEEPFLILSTAILGSLFGILTKLTKIPHFIHVFLSVFASLFYLTSFTIGINLLQFILSLIIVFIAVLIPCCISDIIFPMLFVKKQ